MEKQTEMAVATASENNGHQSVSVYTDLNLYDKYMKMAESLSKTKIVPAAYQGKPDDCLVAIDMSLRLGLPPMMVMQSLYIVQGKPSWSGSSTIALINGCGKFSTDLDWETEIDHKGHGFGMRAFATRKSDGKVCYGSWVTADMVKAENWGPKWKSMPEQMFRYRSATFFARAYCPEILCGLQTEGEPDDSDARIIKQVKSENEASRFIQQQNAAGQNGNEPEDVKPVNE